MKSLDVLIIAQYVGESSDTNSRFREIARNLVAAGAAVELVTSTFVHERKEHVVFPSGNEPFPVTQIREPGYATNVSFARIRSHRFLASNLKAYLEGRHIPDVIYCAIPSLDVARAAAKYASRENVRLIFDVQDLWPEAFEMVLKPKRIARFMFSPLRHMADSLYSASDAIVTVSDTYAARVRQARQDASTVHTVYLGTNLKTFDNHPRHPWSENEDVFQLAYIGTLGRSYDLPLVFDALRQLDHRGVNFRLQVMGSGPLEDAWKEQTQDLGDRVAFHGRLPYAEMVSRLKACDVALNPIVQGSAGSIINKVGDYAAAGLPVISTQDNEEYRHLLKLYNAGIGCDATVDSLVDAMMKLYSDKGSRISMGKGSRHLAEQLFDRSASYQTITDLVIEGA